MRGNVDTIVIFPRWTVFVGTTPTYSSPMDVRAWAEAIYIASQQAGFGGTPAAVTFTIQMSPDLENWTDEVSFSPTAGAEAAQNANFDYAWMRVKAVVAGSDPVVAGWMVADLVRREMRGAA